METIVQRLERLYKTDNWTQQDKEWLAGYLEGDISELYLIALEGFSKEALEEKMLLDKRHLQQYSKISISIYRSLKKKEM